MAGSRSSRRTAGGAPEFTGITTSSFGAVEDPAAPTTTKARRGGRKPRTTTTNAPAAPAGQGPTTTNAAPTARKARGGGRKAPRARGKGRGGRQARNATPRQPANPPAGPAANDPTINAPTTNAPTTDATTTDAPAADAPTTDAANANATITTTDPPAAASAAPAMVPIDPETGLAICVGCAFLQGRIDRRVRTIRQLEAELVIQKRMSKALEGAAKGETRALLRANQEIARLGGVQARRTTPDGERYEVDVESELGEHGVDGETAGVETGGVENGAAENGAAEAEAE